MLALNASSTQGTPAPHQHPGSSWTNSTNTHMPMAPASKFQSATLEEHGRRTHGSTRVRSAHMQLNHSHPIYAIREMRIKIATLAAEGKTIHSAKEHCIHPPQMCCPKNCSQLLHCSFRCGLCLGEALHSHPIFHAGPETKEIFHLNALWTKANCKPLGTAKALMKA